MNNVELVFNLPDDVKALFYGASRRHQDYSEVDAIIRNFVTSGIDLALVNFKGERAQLKPHSKYTILQKRIKLLKLESKVVPKMSGDFVALKRVKE